MVKQERRLALTLLMACIGERVPLSTLLSHHGEASPFTKALCFGVCRHYFRLEAIALRLVDKKPKEFAVWVAIIMGLYELLYLDKPDYAVVKETVSLLDAIKKTWAKGLVNAVLRRFCRERVTLLATLESCTNYQYGQADWLIQSLQTDWPEQWSTLLKAMDEHPPLTLRVNVAKISREDYLKRLLSLGLNAHATEASSVGIILEKPMPVDLIPGFKEGLVSCQDESAQLSVSLLDLAPNLRVLDACAAPGGKTGHILETEPLLAQCVALDIDERRLSRVADNLKRLELSATLVCGDAAKVSDWWDGRLFDRILLDAPCSATGVMRRQPDIRLHRTPDEMTHVVQLQRNILEALWPLLIPGGRMVYATCSLFRVENDQQMISFLSRHEDCQRITPSLPWGHYTGHGWQIFPGEQQRDGFFYSILQKTLY